MGFKPRSYQNRGNWKKENYQRKGLKTLWIR